jgi:hypothetical protein
VRLEAEKWAWQAATKQLLDYYHRVLNKNTVAFAA